MRALFTKLSQRAIVLLVFTIVLSKANAQLKIGDNPTSINKSSILELESNSQGLLLTRLSASDTVTINTLNPPDGMIIFLTSDKSLRLRSNGYWKKLAEFSSTNIQEIAVGAVSNTGDANGISVISTDSLRTLILHAANATNPGVVTAGTQTFGGNKTFQDSVTINNKLTLNSLTTNTTSDSVLVYNNGIIEKRVITGFGSSIHSINGNRDTAQKIAFRNSGTDLTVSTNGADSIFLNVPDAGTSARGVVTTTAQTFAGNKTFQDSVNAAKAILVGATGNANSTMQVSGSLSMSIKTVSSNYTITASDNTILANTTGGAITVTLPAPTGIGGRIYTIKKIGTGGINNALTITPSSGVTIDGGSSYIIYNDWTYVTIQTDGTSWYIIKR